MLNRILTTLNDFGAAAYDVFALPGGVVLSLLATHAPGFAESFNIENGQAPAYVAFLLSLVCWLMLVFLIVRLGRGVARYVGALVRPDLVPALVERRRALVGDFEGLATNPSAELGDWDSARSHLHALLGQVTLEPKDGVLWAHPTLKTKGLTEVSP